MKRARRSGTTALVHHARRGLSLARAGESFLIGASAALLGLWALVVSGAPTGKPDSLICAGLCAFLAGASWWCAHRAGPGRVARMLDRAFAFDGALRTAFEVESAANPPRLGPLLTKRVCARVDRRAALRAVLPRSGALIALPFLAAALFALGHESARAPSAAASLPELTGRLRSELASLADPLSPGTAAPLTAEELAQVFELARRAGELEGARRRGALGPDELALALGELQRDLSQLEASLPSEGELARRLEAAESTLDSARMATRGRGLGAGPGASADAPDGADARGARSDATGELTDAPGDGTMFGLERPPEAARERPAAGYAGGRWWPDDERGLVARWIEWRRAEAGRGPR